MCLLCETYLETIFVAAIEEIHHHRHMNVAILPLPVGMHQQLPIDVKQQLHLHLWTAIVEQIVVAMIVHVVKLRDTMTPTDVATTDKAPTTNLMESQILELTAVAEWSQEVEDKITEMRATTAAVTTTATTMIAEVTTTTTATTATDRATKYQTAG